jgi:hypothetical protein
MGIVERFMAPRLLGGLYADELECLEQVAAAGGARTG